MLQSYKLVSLSQTVGSKIPEWTQGTGGNISQKIDGLLWIKASGERLGDVSATRGLACLEIESFTTQLLAIQNRPNPEANYSELIKRAAIPGFGRPSMESGFHALLPGEFVFHFHSLAAVLMAHEFLKDSKRLTSWISTNSVLRYTFLQNTLPGLELSFEVYKKIENEIFILQNHGVILQSADERIIEDWEKIEQRFLEDWGYQNCSKNLCSIPFKLYFPDSAVFFNQIFEILEPYGDSKTFELKSNPPKTNRDAQEIWLATKWLFSRCPNLEEIPSQLAQAVSGLPTEQYRKSIERSDQ